MNTATNAVVEGKMEPMVGNGDTPRVNVTGQWLYDNFVGAVADAASITRMNQVRILAASATADELKKAFKETVELAKKVDKSNGVPEKERGPKEQYALNVRNIVQTIWGSLRLASKELEAQGFNEQTGYHQAATMARAALNVKNIKWNGSPKPTDETKALQAIQAEKAAKREAFNEAMMENPQGDGEDDTAYAIRIGKLANAVMSANKAEAQKRVVSKIVADIVQKQGRDIALAIAEGLQNFLTATEEMTAEQVDAVLAKHAAESDAQEEAELNEREQQAA